MNVRKKSKRRKGGSENTQNYGKLEDRKLLATVGVVNQQLVVTGNNTSERIDVRQTGSSIQVFENNTFRGSASISQLDPQKRLLIRGNGGDDIITNWTARPSQIEGGAGNDRLTGGLHYDDIDGGSGQDVINGDFDNQRVVFGADWLKGGQGTDTIFGGSGNDVLDGGSRTQFEVSRDNIFGGAGNDTIFGRGGGDYIVGGDGNDTIYGQDGDDAIRGDFGNDNIFAGAGNDFLTGGSGVNVVNGSSGNDVLISGDATSSRNTLIGGTGNDRYRFVGSGFRQFGGTDTIVEASTSPNEGTNDRLELEGVTVPTTVNLNAPVILSYGDRTVFQDPIGNVESSSSPITGQIGAFPSSVNIFSQNGINETARQGLTSVFVEVRLSNGGTGQLLLAGSEVTISSGRELSNTTTNFTLSFDQQRLQDFARIFGSNVTAGSVRILNVSFQAGVFADDFGVRSSAFNVS